MSSRGMTADGYRVSFWGDENGLKLIVVIIPSSVTILKTIELYTLMCELYDVGIVTQYRCYRK